MAFLGRSLQKARVLSRRAFSKPHGRLVVTQHVEGSNVQRIYRATPEGKLETSVESTHSGQPRSRWHTAGLNAVWRYFLPDGFPHTTGEGYLRYVKWSVAREVASTCSGVFATQALLQAVGVGSAAAAPAAAAMNWVLKDGLGQLGGVLVAGQVGSRFDGDPRRWRMLSAYALTTACAMELCTTLVPSSAFVAVAATANVGKNVSWLSASASRAAILKSFMRRNNLADLTAKAGSQTIGAGVVGSALGVTISLLSGGSLWLPFTAFSALHLFFAVRSMQSVQLRSLTRETVEILVSAFCQGEPLPSPSQLHQQQSACSVALPWRSKFAASSSFQSGVDLSRSGCALSELQDAATVCEGEQHVVVVGPGAVPTVSLFMLDSNEGTMANTLLRAYFHANVVRWNLHEKKSQEGNVVLDSLQTLRSQFATFRAEVERTEWNVDSPFMDEARAGKLSLRFE